MIKSFFILFKVGINFLKTLLFFFTQNISKLRYFFESFNIFFGRSYFLLGNSSVDKFKINFLGLIELFRLVKFLEFCEFYLFFLSMMLM